jgi:hypothetical protein
MITVEDILTSSGKHRDREQSPECTIEVRANAKELCDRVNGLLVRLGRATKVSSGFRTIASNKAAGGASKSNHLTGKAVDLADPDGVLDGLITETLLTEFDLYREDPARTPTWVHLQIQRPSSGKRTFHV